MSCSNIYQVIGDYETVETGDHDFLIASKGDVIVDCEVVDENWFRGKNIRSGLIGLIPKENIVAVLPQEYSELEPELIEKLQEEGHDITSPDRTLENTTDDPNEGLFSREEKKSLFSKFSDYVDMSSEEALNVIDEEETDEKPTQQRRLTNPVAKPPRLQETSKGSDEGYNSGSHYSGEPPDSNTPLLDQSKISRQDEAGYEVPSICDGIDEMAESPPNEVRSHSKDRKKKKKKSLIMLWKGKGSGAETKINEKHGPMDDVSENFYNPPPHVKDNQLTSRSANSVFRVVLSFIAALGLAVTLFLTLLLVQNLHPALCFSLAAVLFVAVFVVCVTLLHRGFLCVFALLLPSIVANRMKIGVIILLVLFFILGPVFGIADKIQIARSCSKNGEEWKSLQASDPPSTDLNLRCISEFNSSRDRCLQYYKRVQYYCNNKNPRTNSDHALCNKTGEYFCDTPGAPTGRCTIYPKPPPIHQHRIDELVTTHRFRGFILCLLPLLLLLLLSEAYDYNLVYLTAKDKDNIYITQRLKELDCERKNRGLNDLILPLTRIEFQTYLVRKNWNVTKEERNSVVKWLCLLLIVAFVTVSLVLMEDFVHKVLLDTQSGYCLSFYEYHSSIQYRNIIYSLLGGFLFMIIIQSHVMRLRSVICDYGYPEMVETRSKHLYYKILHDRHTFARHVRRKIQLLSEAKRLRLRISFFSKLYNVLPDKLQWFCSKFSVRKCMICDSFSFRKTVECPETICRAHYCFECHVDAGQSCLTCKNSNASQTSTIARSSFSV